MEGNKLLLLSKNLMLRIASAAHLAILVGSLIEKYPEVNFIFSIASDIAFELVSKLFQES